MAKRLLIHFLQNVLTVLSVVVLIFLLVRLLPGDPAVAFAGIEATSEDIQRIREIMGLDEPLYKQLLLLLKRLAVGDLGKSVRSHLPVWVEISSRIGRTALLAVSALGLGSLIGVALAILATRYPGSFLDGLIGITAVVAYSTPLFWIALVLVDILGVRIRVLPTSGYGTFKHLILPMSVLAFYLMGPIAKLTRGSLLEIMRKQYITTARSKGMRELYILYRHALKNAILPTIAYLGTQAGLLFGGAAIIETVFAWHGLGMLVVSAALSRDYPLLQGCVLVIGIIFVFVNSISEFLYEILDPRLRHRV